MTFYLLCLLEVLNALLLTRAFVKCSMTDWLWAQDTEKTFAINLLYMNFIMMNKFERTSVRVAPLEGTNYDDWKFRLEMLLTARRI